MAIFTAILGWLTSSWMGQVVSTVLGWYQQKQQEQNTANQAEQNAETAHETDGAQSVADQNSSDAQNAGLDQLEKQIDNPQEVVVTPPKGNP